MKKEILINSTSSETRIAITEDGKLVELFFESPDLARNVGDIYHGKIAKVMPGIRAAFINLGFPNDAFLHFSDIETSPDDYKHMIGDDDFDDDDDEETNGKPQNPQMSHERNPAAATLERGKDIIVQILKEPVGNKGLRVTAKVSIPGRYLVLIPFNRRIGISRKIYNTKERRRLRMIVRRVLPQGFGVIIRTVAIGQDENLILDDLNKLIQTWNEIEQKMKTTTPPAILYKDVSTTNSVIRDIFREDVSKMVTDSKKLHKEIKNYFDETAPEYLDRLEYYGGNAPLFDTYHNIEKQIDDSLNKRIYLKNSGYIVIETTEAMTVVDVNSGKYARAKDQELNSLKTNIEAAKEIARQSRLRDIGGIIVVDFIDLYDDNNKRKLHEEIKKEFRKDRAKATILMMSDFGIVQITRQRVRQNIIQRLSSTCPMCSGTGRTQNKMSFKTDIERWLQRYKGGNGGMFLRLRVNPLIKHSLTSGIFFNEILKLCVRYRLVIKLETDSELALSEFKFFTLKGKVDLTEEYDI